MPFITTHRDASVTFFGYTCPSNHHLNGYNYRGFAG